MPVRECSIYPASPIERYKYYDVIRGATEQAKRKADFIKANLDELFRLLNFNDTIDISKVRVHPLVVINLPLGVGIPINNVAVADLKVLQRYIEGKQKFFVQTSAEGEGDGIIEQFYNSEEEAESNLISYLLTPPLFKILSKMIDKEVTQLLPINEKDKDIAYVRFFVKELEIKHHIS